MTSGHGPFRHASGNALMLMSIEQDHVLIKDPLAHSL